VISESDKFQLESVAIVGRIQNYSDSSTGQTVGMGWSVETRKAAYIRISLLAAG
jgi:hypothetical protein